MQETSRSFNTRDRLILSLLFLAISAFHLFVAYRKGPANNWGGRTSEYYALLTDSFLAGKTSLPVEPDPRLLALPNPRDPAANGLYRLHDASLYNGKYYLYFGPTPAIVLFVPYRLLTGAHLPGRVGVALFCIGGFACSLMLFFLLVKREKWDCPLWLAAAAVLGLGTSSLVFFLLIRPSFYEVAIAAGYCCLMGGFLFIAHSLDQPSPRIPGLILAGTCFGLAAGCRPTFPLLAVLMVLLMASRIYFYKARLLAFAGPIVLCGLLLAWYNYARFQNPLEFGNRYQLAAGVQNQGRLFRLENVVPGIYYFLFSPRGKGFPFWPLPQNFAVEQPMIGMAFASPLAFLGLCAPLLCWNRRFRELIQPGSTRFVLYSLYASAAAILTIFVLLGWVVGRYTVDFVPELTVLAWCLVAALWQPVRGLPRSSSLLFQGAVAWFALFSVALDVSSCLQ